ncbi:MAG: hypothetical protein AUH81_09515 [Candidatus Rokubacteria bacterium 13_1_40CM_4_69_5]|nr:MAG: hypothetical protein AUH81_09515 [Candidatus Rokubacteria bacterium 13_1_40CM_4_69_5]
MNRILVIGALLALALSSTAWAENYAVYGADQFFKLDWEGGQRNGRPIVRGYIFNDWGAAAKDLRLRVEALGPSGEVVSTSIGYVAGMVTPGMRAYFEVPVPGAAAAYRVTVLSFEWLQRGKGVL